MTCYRIYFNRLADAPNVWSVDEGTQATEIQVTAVQVIDGKVFSRVNLDETDTENKPKAWLEVMGDMAVAHGVATIYGG